MNDWGTILMSLDCRKEDLKRIDKMYASGRYHSTRERQPLRLKLGKPSLPAGLSLRRLFMRRTTSEQHS